MSEYSIDQFSKITGFNKLLIRTWENRYNFIEPKRSITNRRYYDDIMLTKGIKYSILISNGYKISKIVKFNNKQLNNLIENSLENSRDINIKYRIYVSKFIESAIYLDQKKFDKNYKLCIKALGFIKFYKNILIETMNQISILYLNSEITPANEHFLSENIRIKFAHAIEEINNDEKSKDKWILFLPENEYHDIGLLFAHLILKINNYEIIYLGQNTPRESLLKIKNDNTKFLCFLNTKREQSFIDNLCEFFNKNLKKSNIYIVEKEAHIKKKHENIYSVSKIDDFINFLR